MPVAQMEKTPGPQYFPGDRPEKEKAPNYTMGYRRNKGNQNPMKTKSSTPGNVGPGRYSTESCSDTSKQVTKPRWTLPKAPRGTI